MISAEAFLRKQFEIDESVLNKELDIYRNHMIEFTWMDLREDPEYFFIERYRAGVLDARLLPTKEGDRYYKDIKYIIEENQASNNTEYRYLNKKEVCEDDY